jgi:DNA-directed RNA polymerase I, II, and III subunit RPABC3
LLPIKADTTFSFALASSLLPEGEKEGEGGWRAGIEGSLADDWEYVMYGKVCLFPPSLPGTRTDGFA